MGGERGLVVAAEQQVTWSAAEEKLKVLFFFSQARFYSINKEKGDHYMNTVTVISVGLNTEGAVITTNR